MATYPVTDGVTTFLEPPEDYVVDFDNPQQQKALEHFLIFGTLGSLAFVCLIQRLYTKHFITGSLKVDDEAIRILTHVAPQGSVSIGGLCHHAWEMPIEVYEKHMLSSYIVAPIFITCNGLSKTSLLTVYPQISPQKWFRITIWAAISMVASYTIVIAGLLLFGCQPIRTAWDPYSFGTGKCVDLAVLYIAIAVANIVSDVVLFIIPIPTIVRLKMPKAQKVGAAIMFGIGSVTVATSIVRMNYLPSLLGTNDIPWVAAPANVWSFVEVNLFIICGSMPTFRKFLRRFFPRLMGSSSTSGPSKSSNYDASQSKLHRQQHTGYSQFDTVEMDNFPDKDVRTHTTVVGTGGPLTPVRGSSSRDDNSEEAILDESSIAYTKTFDVKYSNKTSFAGSPSERAIPTPHPHKHHFLPLKPYAASKHRSILLREEMATLSSGLASTLESSLQATAAVSFLTGVVAHITIRPFEIDSKAWAIVFSYLGVLVTTFLGYVCVPKFAVTQAVIRTAAVSNTFNLGLVSSILIYRAFFHRLHRFPGPFLAKLSRFYAMKNAAKNLKANGKIQGLHEKYGDFVRVETEEEGVDERNFADENEALAVYEDRVVSKVDLLMSRIADQEGSPIDVTQYAIFFGFDVMGQVGMSLWITMLFYRAANLSVIGFSKDFEMLNSGKKHPAIEGLHDNMAAVGVLGAVPWLMSMLSKIPGATGSYSRFTDWCGRELQAKRAIVDSEKVTPKDQTPRDVISWLLRAEDEHDRSAPPGEGAFQEDSRLMIIAGSDTTAVALTNALYFLTANPMAYRKLQELVLMQFPGGEKDWTYEKVKLISYLDFVIQETLRLKPSVPAGLARLTPATGIQIDEVFIPGDTIVSVPAYTIHRDPRYWEDALEFRPERWENLNPEKVPWIPFTRGQFSCPGRNLAFMELRMVLSRIALRYDLAFPPGEDGESFDKGARDTFTLNVPQLPIVFTARS
ncbi:benzoate 4-monooxygenase cytochrome [Fusarium albosuccineum]|uniref:Benzoate 4-monooxygenase cytochrome n=1 Tax=Fusarium albosuccineum TaxID=1237068 RepID=A0A8H4LID6_9HYPO|nr:benzoate 4-monooxygenase cytochrome [Fusarium albosuccineum]